MKCTNCGTEFEKGIFCPECGSKFVNETEKAEIEKYEISKLGWPKQDDLNERIRARIEILRKAKEISIETEGARKLINQMQQDIRDDYAKLEKEASGIVATIIVAICFTVGSLLFLIGRGIILTLIGIGLIYAYWNAVVENRRNNE